MKKETILKKRIIKKHEEPHRKDCDMKLFFFFLGGGYFLHLVANHHLKEGAREG